MEQNTQKAVELNKATSDSNVEYGPGSNTVIDTPDLNGENDSSSNKSQNEIKIDSHALNGLRGLISLHVMVFHSLIYSHVGWNILGSVPMSMFILISGFLISLNDGRTQ